MARVPAEGRGGMPAEAAEMMVPISALGPGAALRATWQSAAGQRQQHRACALRYRRPHLRLAVAHEPQRAATQCAPHVAGHHAQQ